MKNYVLRFSLNHVLKALRSGQKSIYAAAGNTGFHPTLIVYDDESRGQVALFQNKNKGSVNENLNAGISAIKEAAENGADLILFPEVQLTEFFPQYPGQDVSGYACELDGEIIQAFQAACRENHIMAVPNVYLREGEIIGIQKMVHVAQAEHFYEQDYYTPSDDGFHVFDTDIGRIGIVVCFDRHYPESIRTEALMGADLILVPTVNEKAEPLTIFEWEIRVQAFQNSVAIAMCNRVGTEDDMQFAGESLVTDAYGNLICKAGDEEGGLYAEVDLKESSDLRNKKPYTQLRRTEDYL